MENLISIIVLSAVVLYFGTVNFLEKRNATKREQELLNRLMARTLGEFTDAVWVYWSRDRNRWNTVDRAVVLDGTNCTWSTDCIGLPGVIRRGDRLAILYDAPGGTSVSHMRRHVGLAWLDLPLRPPE